MNYPGIFQDDSGRLLAIRRVDDQASPFRLRVTLPASLDYALRDHGDYPFEIADELKGWLAHDPTRGEYLKVEAGALQIEGAGPTLNLFLTASGGLSPGVSMGLYDDWDDDLGLPWAFPLSEYRRLESPGD